MENEKEINRKLLAALKALSSAADDLASSLSRSGSWDVSELRSCIRDADDAIAIAEGR